MKTPFRAESAELKYQNRLDAEIKYYYLFFMDIINDLLRKWFYSSLHPAESVLTMLSSADYEVKIKTAARCRLYSKSQKRFLLWVGNVSKRRFRSWKCWSNGNNFFYKYNVLRLEHRILDQLCDTNISYVTPVFISLLDSWNIKLEVKITIQYGPY